VSEVVWDFSSCLLTLNLPCSLLPTENHERCNRQHIVQLRFCVAMPVKSIWILFRNELGRQIALVESLVLQHVPKKIHIMTKTTNHVSVQSMLHPSNRILSSRTISTELFKKMVKQKKRLLFLSFFSLNC